MSKKQALRLLLILVTVLAMYGLFYWLSSLGPHYHAHNDAVIKALYSTAAPATEAQHRYDLLRCVGSASGCELVHSYTDLSVCLDRIIEIDAGRNGGVIRSEQGRFYSGAGVWYECSREVEATINAVNNSKPA